LMAAATCCSSFNGRPSPARSNLEKRDMRVPGYRLGGVASPVGFLEERSQRATTQRTGSHNRGSPSATTLRHGSSGETRPHPKRQRGVRGVPGGRPPARSDSVDLDQILANRIHHGFVAGTKAQLVEDVAHVVLDG